MSFWTDEKVEALKLYWAQGLSSSQVAEKIRGCSRNAVIGKIHRLGLAARDKPSKPMSHGQKKIKGARTRKSGKCYAKVSVGDIPLPESVPIPQTVNIHPKVCGLPEALLARADTQCCFPIGDIRAPDFHYCINERAAADHSYCEPHRKIMSKKSDPALSHAWYEQRREWAKKNRYTQMGSKILKYFATEEIN